eukprot:6212745-Pleurochrysis_carterae.AAC.1
MAQSKERERPGGGRDSVVVRSSLRVRYATARRRPAFGLAGQPLNRSRKQRTHAYWSLLRRDAMCKDMRRHRIHPHFVRGCASIHLVVESTCSF